MTLELNTLAPDFTLLDTTGTPRTLSEFRGSKVALYFYPKDNTPGCTRQACNLRDNFAPLRDKNIVVLGISFDSPERHQAFTAKFNLPFTLLCDTDKKVATTYGATKKFFLATLPKRNTFLIDEKGLLVDIIKKIELDNHAEQILKGFQK